jgi:hypothetical protein
LADRISGYILQSLDYDNFKAAQEADDPAWSRFLHEVWGAGLRLQKLSQPKTVRQAVCCDFQPLPSHPLFRPQTAGRSEARAFAEGMSILPTLRIDIGAFSC